MVKEIEAMKFHLSQTQSKIDQILHRKDEIITMLSNVRVDHKTDVYFVANGSSAEGTRIASYLFLKLFKKNAIYVNPYQFVNYSHKGLKKGDIVIALSQTGTSHLVIESVRISNTLEAITIGMSAAKNSPILIESIIPILFEECAETVDYKITGVLGLLHGLWLIVLGLAKANKIVNGDEVEQYCEVFKNVNAQYDELVKHSLAWTEKNVERLEKSFTMTILASGPLVEVAMEFAVKSIEIQNRFSISVDTEEYLHGICAANTKDNVVILLVDQSSYEYALKVYNSLLEKDQEVIWLGHNAPINDLNFEVIENVYINVAQFMPVVHALLIKWAELKGYGSEGTKIFEYFQKRLKVRESI